MTTRQLRVGLGCMRLSTEPERDERRAVETLHAALDVIPFARRPSTATRAARFIALEAVLDARGRPLDGARATLTGDDRDEAGRAASAVGQAAGLPRRAPPSSTAATLVFAWRPGRVDDGDALLIELRSLAGDAAASVHFASCAHLAGPPVCWCRPPLPGLLLALAAAHDVDPAKSVVVGTSPAHRALAAAVGARFAQGGAPSKKSTSPLAMS